MVRDLHKETKAKVFWVFEKKFPLCGQGCNVLNGDKQLE